MLPHIFIICTQFFKRYLVCHGKTIIALSDTKKPRLIRKGTGVTHKFQHKAQFAFEQFFFNHLGNMPNTFKHAIYTLKLYIYKIKMDAQTQYSLVLIINAPPNHYIFSVFYEELVMSEKWVFIHYLLAQRNRNAELVLHVFGIEI